MTTCAARRDGSSSGCIECVTSKRSPVSHSTGGQAQPVPGRVQHRHRHAAVHRVGAVQVSRQAQAVAPGTREEGESEIARGRRRREGGQQRAGQFVGIFADAAARRAGPGGSRGRRARGRTLAPPSKSCLSRSQSVSSWVMKIAVVGTGYVGLVVGACLAENGNTVACVDKDAAKVETLTAGRMPIYEPGLEELVRRNRGEERLTFTTDLKASVRAASIVFIAVGTPQGEDGSADLQHVLAVARDVGRALNKYTVDRGQEHGAGRHGGESPRGHRGGDHAGVQRGQQSGVPEAGRRGRGLPEAGPRRHRRARRARGGRDARSSTGRSRAPARRSC